LFLKYQNHFEFPKDGKRSLRLKILEFPGGRGGHRRPPGTENPGGWGGVNQRLFRGGGIDIFWNHTIQTLNEDMNITVVIAAALMQKPWV